MNINISAIRFWAITLLLVFCPIRLMAQYEDDDADTQNTHPVASIKYCDSYDDLTVNNWHTADSVWVITKSRIKQ